MNDESGESLKKFDFVKIKGPQTQFPTRQIYLPQETPYREMSREARQVSIEDLKRIWGSESDVIPTLFDESVFSILESSRPRIITVERDFERNTRIMVNALGGSQGTYYIADNGTAHLFAVATALREKGIPVGFYIQSHEHTFSNIYDIRTDTDAMLYYTEEYERLKQKTPLVPQSFATMINYHRVDGWKPQRLPETAFPTPDVLKKNGVVRTVVLGEDYDTARGVIRAGEKDLATILEQYERSGIDVSVLRVDSRKSKFG